MSAGVIGVVAGMLIGGSAGFVFGWNVGWDDAMFRVRNVIDRVDSIRTLIETLKGY